ncbi:MAG: hypothetical protein R2769_03125 [Saprospiraceae bacterium]
MKKILPFLILTLGWFGSLYSMQEVHTIVHFNNEMFELEDPVTPLILSIRNIPG